MVLVLAGGATMAGLMAYGMNRWLQTHPPEWAKMPTCVLVVLLMRSLWGRK